MLGARTPVQPVYQTGLTKGSTGDNNYYYSSMVFPGVKVPSSSRPSHNGQYMYNWYPIQVASYPGVRATNTIYTPASSYMLMHVSYICICTSTLKD